MTNTLDDLDPDEAGVDWALRQGLETVVLLIGPMMPHLAEELWEELGHDVPVAETAWPAADASLLVEDSVTIGVQVNGKMRGTIELPRDSSQESAQQAAFDLDTVAKAIAAKPVRKVIFVPNRIINVLV